MGHKDKVIIKFNNKVRLWEVMLLSQDNNLIGRPLFFRTEEEALNIKKNIEEKNENN